MRRLLLHYIKFCKRINSIAEYIERMMISNVELEKLGKLASGEAEHRYINYLQSLGKSTIQYNAVIISLYGCFENYIDDLFEDFVRILLERTKVYSDLPGAMKNKYRNKVGEFLSSPQRYFGVEIEESQVVEDYLNVLNSRLDVDINPKLITRHSSNLKSTEIINLMNDLGINNPKSAIINDKAFKKEFMTIYDIEEIEYKTKVSRAASSKNGDIFISLDRIVEQRNHVSHGWTEDNRINISDIVRVDIPFILLFSKTILRLCMIEVFKRTSPNEYSFTTRNPIMTIKNHILCMNSQGNMFSIGDFLLYKSGSTYKCSEIVNLQIERKDVAEISMERSINIGIELVDTIKSDDEVCIIVNKIQRSL